MKKLMFAVAAVAAGVAMADVTSANIVGYQNKNLPNQGYNFACPSFLGVGAKTVNLQEIKLIGGIGDMSESIVVYNADAIYEGEQYFWVSESMGAPEGDGWYDYTMAAKLIKSFPQGTGIYLNCPTEGAYLSYSGEVDTSSQEHDLVQIGYNIIGNATPVDISLQDIKLVGAVGDMSESIVVYNADAIYEGEQYFWVSEGMGAPEGDGWYDYTMAAKLVKTIKAGEGLYLNCPTADVKWTVPSPIKPVTAD